MELKKTLDSPLDSKGIKEANPNGNQHWLFIWGTDAEPEAPILWPPDGKSQCIGEDLDAEKDWQQKEKGAAERRWLDSIIDSVDINLSKLWEIVEVKGALHATDHKVPKNWAQFSDWTTTTGKTGNKMNIVKMNTVHTFLHDSKFLKINNLGLQNFQSCLLSNISWRYIHIIVS